MYHVISLGGTVQDLRWVCVEREGRSVDRWDALAQSSINVNVPRRQTRNKPRTWQQDP